MESEYVTIEELFQDMTGHMKFTTLTGIDLLVFTIKYYEQYNLFVRRNDLETILKEIEAPVSWADKILGFIS